MEGVQLKYVPISTLAKIWGRSKMYIYRRIDMLRNEGGFNEICMQLGQQQTLVHIDKFEAWMSILRAICVRNLSFPSRYIIWLTMWL